MNTVAKWVFDAALDAALDFAISSHLDRIVKGDNEKTDPARIAKNERARKDPDHPRHPNNWRNAGQFAGCNYGRMLAPEDVRT